MRVRYSYFTEYTPELARCLESLGFLPENFVWYEYVKFNIYDDDTRLKIIKEKFPDLSMVQAKYKFSKKEMESAQWFTLRPTNSKLESRFADLTFAGSCLQWQAALETGRASYNHYSQRAPYIMSRQTKWGKSQFLACSTYRFRAIFCSDLARSIIENSGLRGCAFAPVLYYKDASPMPDISQFIIETVIPGDRVRIQGVKEKCRCPVCRREKYIVDSLSRPVVDLNALRDMDFYITEANHAVERDAPEEAYFILSKRAYTLFKEHGMTGSFEVFPLFSLDFGSDHREINYGKNEVPACGQELKEKIKEHFTAQKKQEQAERKDSAEKCKARANKEKAEFERYCERRPDSVMPDFLQELSELGYRTEIFMDVVRIARLHGDDILPLAWKYYRQAKHEYERILMLSLFCFNGGGRYIPQLLQDYTAPETPEDRRAVIAQCVFENRAEEYADEYVKIMAGKRYGQSRQTFVLLAGELKLENAVPVLIKLLDEGDFRLHALVALSAYRREDFRPYFLRFKNSEDLQIRQAAIMALQKLSQAWGKHGGNQGQ